MRASLRRLNELYVQPYEGKTIKALNGRVLVPTSTWKAMHVPGQGVGA